MSRELVLIVLGILVALSPYLGVPLSTLAIILPIVGLLVAAIGLTQRARLSVHAQRPPEAVPAYEIQEA